MRCSSACSQGKLLNVSIATQSTHLVWVSVLSSRVPHAVTHRLVYCAGTTIGASFSLTIKTTNFAGWELLAFFETVASFSNCSSVIARSCEPEPPSG
jgi:hypothetical protein